MWVLVLMTVMMGLRDEDGGDDGVGGDSDNRVATKGDIGGAGGGDGVAGGGRR